MEIYIGYMHLIERKLRIGHVSSMEMEGHIISSFVFSTKLTVLETEETGIPRILLMFCVC